MPGSRSRRLAEGPQVRWDLLSASAEVCLETNARSPGHSLYRPPFTIKLPLGRNPEPESLQVSAVARKTSLLTGPYGSVFTWLSEDRYHKQWVASLWPAPLLSLGTRRILVYLPARQRTPQKHALMRTASTANSVIVSTSGSLTLLRYSLMT